MTKQEATDLVDAVIWAAFQFSDASGDADEERDAWKALMSNRDKMIALLAAEIPSA